MSANSVAMPRKAQVGEASSAIRNGDLHLRPQIGCGSAAMSWEVVIVTAVT